MSVPILFVVTILIILALILMGYHSADVFHRAVDVAPYFKKKCELKNEIDNLKVKIKDTHRKISDLNQTLDSLRAEVVKGEYTIAEAAEAKKWLAAHNAELASKKATIAELNQEIEELTDKYNDLDDKYEEKLSGLRTQVQDLDGQIRNAQNQLNKLQDDIASAKKEKEAAEAAKSQALNDKAVADTEKQAAEQAAAAAKKAQEVAEEAKVHEEAQLKAAQIAKALAEAEKNRLETENARLQGEIDQAKTAKQNAEQEKEVAEAAKNAAESARAKAEKEKELAEEAKKTAVEEKEKEQKTLNEVKAERILNEKTRDEAAKEIEGMKLPDKRAEKADLDNAIAELRTDLKTLESEKEKRQQLDEDVRKLEGRKSALQGEVADLEQKQSDRNRLAAEIAELTGKLDPLRRDSAVIEDRIKRCWEDLDTAMPNIITEGDYYREKDWLFEFKSNLEAAHIVFPERTLLAFHTSMKVQDCSPMAVLAGISGTGKSLLPELYAHALGMNFLQVAVQPRWDSPQDLLGFYNYMEYRFKATELSRLLWQADLYNNKDWAHNSMNLVLLDEMNLARVEYYFSDMLSKLEVRRGIDPENEKERHAAEIELECCAGLPKRRLFIGANTLFVGTMNEDESTQSLSDKVLDRANVIRFGKPTELNVKPDKQAFLKACVKNGPVMMTLPDWQSWRCQDGGGVADKLVAPLQEINNKLMEIRRPFGHRVWQSIQAYVENYPGGANVRSEAFRHALADQIEMKILPKLNGVDKQDSNVSRVLLDLRNTISSATRDDKLVSAMEDVIKDASNAFFQWKGVSR